MIDRLVNRGVGIQVGTELHADGLAPGYNAQLSVLAGEVLRTVKRHVLQEVGQSALTGFLQNGAYTLGNIEISQSRLFRIMADIIGHSIVQTSHSERGVLWQSLGYCHDGQQHQYRQSIYLLHHHYFFIDGV